MKDDAISRQAAIDAFGLSEKTRKYGGDHSGYNTLMLYEIQDVIEDLPSVSTENPNRSEIKQKCDRINSLASVLPYAPHREIQELLCDIMDLCKAESEDAE